MLLVSGRGALAGGSVPAAAPAHPVTRLGTGPGETLPAPSTKPPAPESPSKQTQKPWGSRGTPARPRHAREDAALSTVNPSTVQRARTLSAWPSTTLQHFSCNSQMLFAGTPYPWQLAQGPFGNVLPHVLPQTLPRCHKGHRPGWHAAVPGTTSTHRGGWQRPSETWLRGEGGGRRFVYITLLFQTALGAAVRDSPAREGKGGHPAPSHPGLHLPAREDRPPSPRRDPRRGLGTQAVAEPPMRQAGSP